MEAQVKDEKVVVLGMPIDNLNTGEVLARVTQMVADFQSDGRARYVATVNVDFLVHSLGWRPGQIQHPELLEILRKSDLVTPDGMPLVWASRMLKTPLQERVTGADLVPALIKVAAEKNLRVYFLGGQEGVARRLASKLKASFPRLEVAGFSSPMVATAGTALTDSHEDDERILEEIHHAQPDLLFIALGNPKQELWFHRNRKKLKVPVSFGIGGTFDFMVGNTKRAPQWVQKSGLEWIYRFCQEPKRLWKRYFLGFFKFGFMILPHLIYQRLKGGKSKETPQDLNQTQVPEDTGERLMVMSEEPLEIIELPTRLVSATLPQVREEITPYLEKSQAFLLDFQKVNFIDSSGLGFLIEMWRQCEAKNIPMSLARMSESVQSVFKLSRTWDLFADKLIHEEKLGRFKVLASEPSVFDYQLDTSDNPAILHLSGRLDAFQVEKINLTTLMGKTEGLSLLVDLSQVKFMDSSGLRLLLQLSRAVAAQNKRFFLYGLNESIRQVIHVAQLDHFFAIAQHMPERVPDVAFSGVRS